MHSNVPSTDHTSTNATKPIAMRSILTLRLFQRIEFNHDIRISGEHGASLIFGVERLCDKSDAGQSQRIEKRSLLEPYFGYAQAGNSRIQITNMPQNHFVATRRIPLLDVRYTLDAP